MGSTAATRSDRELKEDFDILGNTCIFFIAKSWTGRLKPLFYLYIKYQDKPAGGLASLDQRLKKQGKQHCHAVFSTANYSKTLKVWKMSHCLESLLFWKQTLQKYTRSLQLLFPNPDPVTQPLFYLEILPQCTN